MNLRRPFPLLAFAAAALAAAPGLCDEFRFEKLNRTYVDFAPEFGAFEESGVEVTLGSPSQTLVLRDHRVRLTPVAGGLFAGEVELDVQGKGRLIADVVFGPLAERFDEEVLVPPQTLAVQGTVRMRRVDGGYAIDAVELPKEIEIAIQSPTINNILSLCDQAAILSLGSIDCGGLDRALTRPKIPIPSGHSFTLQDIDLTDADRRGLEALLAGAPTG